MRSPESTFPYDPTITLLQANQVAEIAKEKAAKFMTANEIIVWEF